jgi:hypothetical protein
MPRRLAPIALGSALLLSACVSPKQAEIQKEDLLVSAGFVPRPADTPHRKELLRTLPPNIFVMQIYQGQQKFVFADPLVCGCLYVGDADAYNRYKVDVIQRQIAREEQLAAQNSDFDMGEFDHGKP